MQFFALLMQYAPLILGFINTAESVVTAVGTKPTGQEKLAAVTSAIVTAAPAIGATIAANPDHSNHLADYVSGTVSILNALNGWTTAQTATTAAQQSATSGA